MKNERNGNTRGAISRRVSACVRARLLLVPSSTTHYMSSLAATQADGYYVPPEYLESGAYKKKSINQFNKSKGHNQFLQRGVCRFELPFDGFCTKCDAICGKGTRYNTHKAHVDDYFTTKIYEFTTRCRACGDCEFKIRTNPKERTFDYVSGIRKKVEEFDTVAVGTHGVIDTEVGNGIHHYSNGKIDAPTTGGALNALEKSATGLRKKLSEAEHVESLLQVNAKLETDSDANAAIRKAFRTDRKAKKRRLGAAGRMGLGRGIELATENEGDAAAAKLAIETARHRSSDRRARESERHNFSSVRTESIFASQKRRRGGSSKRRKERSGGSERRSNKAASSSAGPKRTMKLSIGSQGVQSARMAESSMQQKSTTTACVLGSLACYTSDSSE